jgi:hypothetical protein
MAVEKKTGQPLHDAEAAPLRISVIYFQLIMLVQYNKNKEEKLWDKNIARNVDKWLLPKHYQIIHK